MPIKREPEVQQFLDSFSLKLFNRTNDGFKCVCCGSTKVDFTDFKDDISRKEFSISGMCQSCQNSTFDDPLMAQFHGKEQHELTPEQIRAATEEFLRVMTKVFTPRTPSK